MTAVSTQERIYQSTFEAAPSLSKGNLFDLISKRASQRPYEIAFIRDDGKRINNATVISLSRRLAYTFRHKFGLQQGDKVCIFSPNHTMYPIAVYACEIAGLISVLVNPASTSKELSTFLGLSESKVLLYHPSIQDKTEEALSSYPAIQAFIFEGLDVKETQELNNTSSENDDIERRIQYHIGEDQMETTEVNKPEDETAFICFSSGTTGLAKGVEITHGNVIASLAQMLVTHDQSFTSDDLQIGVLPFCHIYGLVKLLHHPFMIGMPVVVMQRFDMRSFCYKIELYKATITLLVPPIILLLSNSTITKDYNLSSLKIIQSGGAPLSVDLVRQVCSKWPNLRIIQGYGLTESCPSVICTGPPHLPTSSASVGRIAPGVLARLIDDNGNDLVQPKIQGSALQGELLLHGPSIMKGYLNNDEANAIAFEIDEYGRRWFRTGDVASFQDDEIFIVDRKKELIKYKGFQVPPAELEALLLTNENVADVIVVGVYDHLQASELPRAYIVPNDRSILYQDESVKTRFTGSIAKWTAENVSNHKKLRGGVYLVQSIPKSSSGKLLRRVIRLQMEMAAASSNVELVPAPSRPEPILSDKVYVMA
jgi:4-coumarate--CoA ligase